MEVVFAIAGLAVLLLLAELLLPTGGLLALIGAAGLVGAGILALNADEPDAGAIGAGLITAGVLSIAAFVIIVRKVAAAHHDQPVRTGWEEMIGREAEVRVPLDPAGQVYADGSLWRARPAADGTKIDAGNRVRVEALDGLTLVVAPLDAAKEPSKGA
ncbi:MAG: NfeD family protein [Solirubrobacterales bacterium]